MQKVMMAGEPSLPKDWRVTSRDSYKKEKWLFEGLGEGLGGGPLGKKGDFLVRSRRETFGLGERERVTRL